MRKLAFIIVVLATIMTIGITVYAMGSPSSIIRLGFVAWVVSPYGLLAFLIKAASSKAAIIGVLILSVLTSLFGLISMIDATYIHHDPQGGLIYIFVPLWQWVGLLISALLVLLLSKVKNV